MCSPADNIHTVRAPSQGSNSISRAKVVFHFILSEVFIPYCAVAEFVGWIFHIEFWSVHSRCAVFFLLYFIISPGHLEWAAGWGSLELELVLWLIWFLLLTLHDEISYAEFSFLHLAPVSLLLCLLIWADLCISFLTWSRCSGFPASPDLV